jgi:hypothetical protein
MALLYVRGSSTRYHGARDRWLAEFGRRGTETGLNQPHRRQRSPALPARYVRTDAERSTARFGFPAGTGAASITGAPTAHCFDVCTREPRGIRGLVPRNIIGTSGFSIGRYTTKSPKRTMRVQNAPETFDSARNINITPLVNGPSRRSKRAVSARASRGTVCAADELSGSNPRRTPSSCRFPERRQISR